MHITAGSDYSGNITLTLIGELDIAAVAQVHVHVEQALTAHDCKELTLDLAQVTFVDSTGIGALVAARNTALASHKELHLRRVSRPVRRVLELSTLDTVFAIDDETTITD